MDKTYLFSDLWSILQNTKPVQELNHVNNNNAAKTSANVPQSKEFKNSEKNNFISHVMYHYLLFISVELNAVKINSLSC